MARLTPLLALAVAGPLAAQTPDARLLAAANRAAPKAVEYRHDIHQHPELSNRETRTAALVADRLRALGMEATTGVAKTGVVAVLKGGRPGPFIAIRADMDALPVLEETDLPFKSTATAEYEGRTVPVSHACGHDVHVAVLLGVAEVLAGMRDRLPGTVQFIFQPAEEGAPSGEQGGAKVMLTDGVWRERKPDAVFALHTFAQMPVGTVGYTPGPMLAGAQRWQATVIGRSAHGARPNLSIDPVVMAAEVVMALQTIRSRSLSPLTPSVVTVGRIAGGTRNNIIPTDVSLDGTIRFFSTAVQDTIQTRIREILTGVTMAYGGKFTLDFSADWNPPTVNDSALAAFAGPVLRNIVGADRVQLIEPTTGAEDFAFFAREVPGFYFRLGTVAPGTTSGDHHTPTFRADDGAIPVGIRAMTGLVLAYLERPARR